MINKSVLIIEDTKDIAVMLCLWTEKAGYPCDIAHTIAEAVKAASKRFPEIVVLDYQLKNGEDGSAVFDALTQLAQGRGFHVIIASALEDQDIIGVLEAHIKPTAHLSKPTSRRTYEMILHQVAQL